MQKQALLGLVSGTVVAAGLWRLRSRLAPAGDKPGPKMPLGSMALKIKLFDTPHQELASALYPPWPRWMRRLYEVEGVQDPEVNPGRDEVTASAAISAVATRLSHRLKLLAWITGQLQSHNWEIEQHGDHLIAYRIGTPQFLREDLEEGGIAGPLLAVTEADAEGWPRLYHRWELK